MRRAVGCDTPSICRISPGEDHQARPARTQSPSSIRVF